MAAESCSEEGQRRWKGRWGDRVREIPEGALTGREPDGNARIRIVVSARRSRPGPHPREAARGYRDQWGHGPMAVERSHGVRRIHCQTPFFNGARKQAERVVFVKLVDRRR